MAMRVTGMYSGLDTETIIQELVAARQTKVDDLKKEQTTLEWKQDAWKDLNGKIKKLFDGTLSNLRYQASFMKKTTSVSNSNLVSILTSDSAMDSVQSLKIKKMAKAGYLTGGKMEAVDGGKLSSGSTLSRLGIGGADGDEEKTAKFEINVGGKITDIEVDGDTTISSLVSKLQSAGVNANFDAASQRLFVGASGTGSEKDFTITSSNAEGTEALSKLGILVYDEGDSGTKAAYQKYADLAGNAEAKAAAISSRKDALIKSYKAERESLITANKKLVESRGELADAYKEAYEDKDGFIDITDAAARAGRKTALNDEIKSKKDELKEKLEDTTLTEEDKQALQTEYESSIRALEGELSYINAYDENVETVSKNEVRIGVLEDADHLNMDSDGNFGEVGSAIEEEATAYVQEKIDHAISVINNWNTADSSQGSSRVVGQDAEILLNGAEFTSDSNTFEVNGLTITCKGETADGEEITLTTESDTSGIYDMIKGFIKEYSELINEMDKLYNAESTRGYEPLTDDEKDAMSDKEVEKWEEKIKGSLLRRDSTLNSVSSAMKQIMASGFSVNGRTMYLSDFGIETLGYFNAADNEKNAYHINGDEDDDAVKSKDNDLLAMIRSDPDSVVGFFTQLSQSLHGKLSDLMKGTDYSSAYTVYDDKKMKQDYESYKTKISDAEKKLQAYEDKWYSKFSAMETALAKLQSNANAVTSLLGG